MSTDRTTPITPDMKVATLLDTFPELEAVLIDLAPAFKKLKNPVLRKTVAKVATLERAAGMADIPTRELIVKLRAAVGQPTDEADLAAPTGSACSHLHTISSTPPTPEPASDAEPDWFCECCTKETIDADAILAKGEVPIGQIVKSAKALGENDILKITVDFRPLPMIDMLEKQGFQTYCQQTPTDGYALFVTPGKTPPTTPTPIPAASDATPCKCNPALATTPPSDSGGAATMGEHIKINPGRMETILSITIDLFNDVPMSALTQRFQTELGGRITPAEFALSEQKLSERGITDEAFHDRIEEIIGLFKRSLAESAFDTLPEWHPVQTFVRENIELTGIAKKLQATPIDPHKAPDPESDALVARRVSYERLRSIEQHYQRKEHLLFPYLEEKGFTKPTVVMWRLQDEIRADIKRCRVLLDEQKWEELAAAEPAMITDLLGMVFKEEHILLPTALDMLSDQEWLEIRAGESDIGYCLIDPPIEAAAT